jgi:UDP-GlcNAc:undecaprenyl-phosphate/decaprenyl-phosphate GlcNAc-1-phosphate transferase
MGIFSFVPTPWLMAAKVGFCCTVSFITTFYLVPLLVDLAVRLGVVDVPDGRIKQHKVVTPYLGGLAVYAGFLAGLALVIPVENRIMFLLIGSTLLLMLGLIDDLVALAPYQKFVGQILAVLCFLKGGLFLKDQFFLNQLWCVIPLSVLWCLTIINGFNLIDVMDGLATTTAIGCAVSYLAIAVYFKDNQTILLLVAFIGSLLAFLWYNRPRASIYLGDAGALFIGGFLSALPFFIPWSSLHQYAFICPLIILAIPLFETGSLICIRTIKQIPFYRGSPDHFCHYLQRWGWSIPQILVFVALANLLLAGITFTYLLSYVNLAPIMVVAIAIFATWIAFCRKKR